MRVSNGVRLGYCWKAGRDALRLKGRNTKLDHGAIFRFNEAISVSLFIFMRCWLLLLRRDELLSLDYVVGCSPLVEPGLLNDRAVKCDISQSIILIIMP